MNYRTAMDERGNAIPIDIEKREKEYRKSATSHTQMPVWMPYEMETFFLEKNSQA